MTRAAQKSLLEHLISRYGPTIGGHDLYAALGFKSYAAFYRSKQRQEIGIKVFTLPGRRGWFALSTDVAEWLEKQVERSADLDMRNGTT